MIALIMQGYLSKEGHLFKTWKTRFFHLDGCELKYYDSDSKTKLKGRYVINVESKCNIVDDHKGKQNLFALQAKGDNSSDIILLSAASADEKMQWVSEINRVISARQLDLDILCDQVVLGSGSRTRSKDTATSDSPVQESCAVEFTPATNLDSDDSTS